MASTRFARRPAPLAWAVLALLATQAHAQNAAETTDLPPVTVTGRSTSATASVGGFGDIPLSRAPLQATVLSAERLKDGGVHMLADVTRFDASLSDAYNSEGYWSNFTIRGFTIDNRYNYRRDGLPINAETSLALDNKSRIEVLKGTSGIQAGTSAPGGLVNLTVKRPEGSVRSAFLGWRQDNTLSAAVDIGQRFGENEAFGLRVNAVYEHLDPRPRSLEGHRSLLAVAGDWRLGSDTLLEAEIEASRQAQPSVPGFSLLGNTLPDPKRLDPRTNLNNQPWSQPVVLNGNTASLRLQQRLNDAWRAVAHFGTQRLTSDDRIAFPYGCSAENAFDRYCSNGTYDLYDYRSDHEHRNTDALDLGLQGKLQTAGMAHELSAGVLLTRFRTGFQPQAFNLAGVGNIDGTLVTPPAADLSTPGANRKEHSTELYLRDAIALSQQWSTWLGLRHTRLHRSSLVTDGSGATDYTQGFTTPWLALGYEMMPGLLAYASWGQGIESEVVPNRPPYANAGQALAPLKSRQLELGIKRSGQDLDWALTLFDIDKPHAGDICDATFTSCLRRNDGTQRHRGLEGEAEWKLGNLALQAGAMLLDTKLHDVTGRPELNGKRPTNVPEHTLKLNAHYRIAAIAGLSVTGGMIHEGKRMALEDNSAGIPGWTRFDASARYEHRLGTSTLTWRIGVDNLTDKRAWKESPFQFSHVYLYPLAPRTWRVSVQANL